MLVLGILTFQKQSLKVLYTKGVLKNFAKLTEKHLCRSLFSNKITGSVCNFVKKNSSTDVFV